jgi:hypothetical protein
MRNMRLVQSIHASCMFRVKLYTEDSMSIAAERSNSGGFTSAYAIVWAGGENVT